MAHLGDDLSPLQAARMSTGNPTGQDEAKDDKLRRYLWDHRHLSPFEFGELVVEVTCPIFVARQWMRHRTQSYNEFSGRYSEMDLGYWQPEAFRQQGTSNKQGSGEPMPHSGADVVYAEAIRAAACSYRQLLSMGVSREQARAVLPLASMTRFRAKANLRNWLAFLRERLDDAAQDEIRVLARQVAAIIQERWPRTYEVAGLPEVP